MVMDQDPNETLPAPDVVGREFVRQYYTLLNEAPEHAHRFYNSNSYFVHGSMTQPAIGQLEIHQKIQQLNFRDCHAKISQVDSQVTLGNGVVVQVSGELSNDGLPMRRFSQTFVLGTQSPKKYYVHNDIFRYQDMLQSDEEGDVSPEKEELEIEQQEPAYYQANAIEPAAPQQQQVTPGLNVNAPPHTVNVNGTGGLHREEPIPAPEPVIIPEPAPAPVMNGGVSMMGGEDLNRVLQNALAKDSDQSGHTLPVQATGKPEEVSAQPIIETVNNKDTYEEDNYQPINADPNEKKTFANLFRDKPRGNRGGVPLRSVRSAPAPTQSTPPQQQQQSVPRSEAPPSEPPSTTRYPDNQQVFVGNLSPEVSESELKQIFSEFGKVCEVRIHVNRTRESGAYKNYGFVIFEEISSVQACLKNKPSGVRDLNVEEKRRQRSQGGGGNHESGGWSMGRGQSGRGRGSSRGAPRGSSYRGGPPPPASSRSQFSVNPKR